MNTLDAIWHRRAVRAYSERKVEEEAIRALLRAAVQAPSAMNAQPWVFAVIQDTAQLARYSERAKSLLLERSRSDSKARRYNDLLRSPSFNIFYDAGTLVVIGVEERGHYTDADCWLAAANLMLAACDAGLGTCCIGFAVPALNTPEAKQELGLPPAGVAVAPIIVGYPSSVPAPVSRAEPRIVAWSR